MMDLTLQPKQWAGLTVPQRRVRLMQFEEELKKHEDKSVLDVQGPDCIKEYLCNGIYARELTVPAGTVISAGIHKHANITVVSQGKVRVATEEGVRTIEAPCTFISSPGIKRAAYIMEDTVWTTFHATQETDSKKLWDEIIAPNYEELDKFLENK